MNNDIQLFTALERHAGYQALEELWRIEISGIEAKRDNAAKRGNESSWRYWAGLEYGYKKAVMKLREEILRYGNEESLEEKPSEKIEKLMAEARGEIQ